MTLTDILRTRMQGAEKSATFVCGQLGNVRAQALSPSEHAALSRSGDSNRAVFYAACRDLQTAGEALRREGKIFTPDQVMQFVSDEEAKVGADTVGRLSNLGGSPTGEKDAEARSDGEGHTAHTKREGQSENADAEGPQENVEDDGLPENADDEGQTDHGERQDIDGYAEIGAIATEEKSKVRRDFVQSFVNPDSERRHPFVQTQRVPDKQEVRCSDVQKTGEVVQEIRPEIVQNKRQEEKPVDLRSGGGQVSREFFGENRPMQDNLKQPEILDKETQTVAFETERATQDVSILCPIKKQQQSKQLTETLHQADGNTSFIETEVHESMSKSVEGVHESKSELPRVLHETKSESGKNAREPLHELKSELPEALHETKSEFDKNTGESLHEMKSEFAEFALRTLLSGLLCAAAVR